MGSFTLLRRRPVTSQLLCTIERLQGTTSRVSDPACGCNAGFYACSMVLPIPELTCCFCACFSGSSMTLPLNMQTVPSGSDSAADDTSSLAALEALPLLSEFAGSTAFSTLESASPTSTSLPTALQTPTLCLDEARRDLEGVHPAGLRLAASCRAGSWLKDASLSWSTTLRPGNWHSQALWVAPVTVVWSLCIVSLPRDVSVNGASSSWRLPDKFQRILGAPEGRKQRAASGSGTSLHRRLWWPLTLPSSKLWSCPTKGPTRRLFLVFLRAFTTYPTIAPTSSPRLLPGELLTLLLNTLLTRPGHRTRGQAALSLTTPEIDVLAGQKESGLKDLKKGRNIEACETVPSWRRHTGLEGMCPRKAPK